MKPIIGISANLLITEGGMFSGMERAYVNYDYVQAISNAGGIPVLLPVVDEQEMIEEQVKLVDGILLSGGWDINPLYYQEEPCLELGEIFPAVDEHQLSVTTLAAKLNKPLLGICRGIQIMNVAFGGSLYQDLAKKTDTIKHQQKSQRHVPGHSVKIIPDTVLADIFPKDELIFTNSFHHQAVKDIAEGFSVNALAADGTIEGIEKKGDVFTLGVQWHPEMMAGQSALMRNIFKAFVIAAEK